MERVRYTLSEYAEPESPRGFFARWRWWRQRHRVEKALRLLEAADKSRRLKIYKALRTHAGGPFQDRILSALKGRLAATRLNLSRDHSQWDEERVQIYAVLAATEFGRDLLIRRVASENGDPAASAILRDALDYVDPADLTRIHETVDRLLIAYCDNQGRIFITGSRVDAKLVPGYCRGAGADEEVSYCSAPSWSCLEREVVRVLEGYAKWIDHYRMSSLGRVQKVKWREFLVTTEDVEIPDGQSGAWIYPAHKRSSGAWEHRSYTFNALRSVCRALSGRLAVDKERLERTRGELPRRLRPDEP